MNSIRPLTRAQQNNLSALLEFGGTKIFPFAAAGSPDATTIRNITSSARPMGSRGSSFTVGTGRLEIDDDRAVFIPSDGTAKIEAVAVPTPAEAAVIAAANASAGAVPATRSSVSYGFSASSSVTVNGKTVYQSTATRTPPAAVTMKFSRSGSIVMVIASVLSAMLAVMLIIGAVQVLRDSPRARRTHRVWALVKFPVIALDAVGTYLVYASMMGSMSATLASMPGGAPTMPNWANWVALATALAMTLFALIYPISVLIVFSTRRITQYYASIGAGGQIEAAA
jgi:hypothetical protein